MVTEHFDVESVPAALDGQRVDRIVAFVADISRRQATDLIAAGGVEVDGAIVERPSIKVAADSSVVFTVDRPPRGPSADEAIDVEVVFVDEAVIVVDKPAGLVVHPGSGTPDGTLVNGLLARFPELASVGPPERPGVVHRLDKGTSGLLMVGRTSAALDSLSGQLASRTVERVYRALVLGTVEADKGLIDAPLGRSPRDPTRRAVVTDGRPARTRYEVLERRFHRGVDTTSLQCRLETGRTHQIRAHLAAIDHPVAGDSVYGGAVDWLDRPFLHAESLAFDHPTTGDRLRFDSPLPSELTEI